VPVALQDRIWNVLLHVKQSRGLGVSGQETQCHDSATIRTHPAVCV